MLFPSHWRSPGPSNRAGRARRLVCCLLGWLALVGALRAEEGTPPRPQAGPPAPPVKPAASTPPPAPTRVAPDLKNLPPGTVIILCDDLKKGLSEAGPKSVVLTAEEYQRLLDQLAQARAATEGGRPAVPSVCRLTGQVRDNVVHFTIRYEFPTTRPDTAVLLGCRQGYPTEVALDGGKTVPLLQPTDDGFVLQVEKPGDHQVTLGLDVGLTSRGAEHGLELDLPRAPITTLDLELADPAVKEVRLNPSAREGRPQGQNLVARVADGKNRVTALLGALGRLDLAWRGPAQPPSGPPVLTAEGRVTVHVGENHLITDLSFTLKALRGQAAEWRFLLPGPAKLDPARAPDPRIQGITQPDRANPGLNVLQLKGPTADPLEVALQIVQARSGPSQAVGPFAVLGAFPHIGTLLVAAPPHLRLTPQVRGEPQVTLAPRDLTDEERRREPEAVAAFNYRTLLAPQAGGPPAPPPPPFLQIDIEKVRAGSATQMAYTLRLTERGWRLTTDVEVTPQGAGGVDRLEVRLPPGWEEVRRVPRPDTAGAHMEVDTAAGTVLVALPAKRTDPFHVALEALYPLAPADGTVGQPQPSGSMALELPRPRKTIDRGGQVTVQVPRGMELVAPQSPDPAWDGLAPGKAEYSWRTEHTPERVAVSWRVPRPEVASRLVADVTLSAGQARVRQQCVFPTPPLPAQVLLWVPESLGADRIQLAPERGRPVTAEEVPLPQNKAGFRAWLVVLTAAVDRDHPLVLDYSFPLPEAVGSGTTWRPITVPLIVPEQAGRAETAIHVWCEPGGQPVLAGGPWEEFSELTDRDVVPPLCLRGRRPEQAPALRLYETASALALVSVERALVRVTVDDQGGQEYRARFLLPQVLAPYLYLEFPAPVAGLNPTARLQAENQEKQVGWVALDENGQPSPGGKVARLAVPEAFARKPLLLEVAYPLSPDRAPGSGLLLTMLYPPVLRGDVGRFPVRVEVRLPESWVPIYPEGDFALEQRWGWRGFLPAPRPSVSEAALEGWLFSGYETRLLRKASAPAPGGELGPSCLVCWRSSAAPFRLAHAPEQAWLLFCSAALVAAGLCVYFLGRVLARPAPSASPAGAAANGHAPPSGSWARALAWPVAGGTALVVASAALLWPGVLGPVLYGCEPGAAVLLCLLGIELLSQQRYRRRVVFLRGFARAKPGSSLVRPGSSNPSSRPRGEPSTVDAPPAPHSSKP